MAKKIERGDDRHEKNKHYNPLSERGGGLAGILSGNVCRHGADVRGGI